MGCAALLQPVLKQSLTLTLLVTRIAAYHVHRTAATYYLAILANSLDTRSNFHNPSRLRGCGKEASSLRNRTPAADPSHKTHVTHIGREAKHISIRLCAHPVQGPASTSDPHHHAAIWATWEGDRILSENHAKKRLVRSCCLLWTPPTTNRPFRKDPL